MTETKVTFTQEAPPLKALGNRNTERYPPEFVRIKFRGRWYNMSNMEMLRLYIRLSHMQVELDEREG